MKKYLEIIKHVVHKYLIEVILIAIAFLLAIGSFVLFLNTASPSAVENISPDPQPEKEIEEKIYAEISGSVAKPGVYELEGGSRLEVLVEAAEGLSLEADKDYFARNFNLARLVQDQEKIYIPSRAEISLGLFAESQSPPAVNSAEAATSETSGKININSASKEELDELSGVGEVTAQKIIDNRPYQAIDELLSKKVVGQSVFEKIKEQITAN